MVSGDDLNSAASNAKLIAYYAESCQADGFEGKYTIQGRSDSGRLLTIIFSANKFTRKMKLITVWEKGKEYDCPNNC